MGYPPWLLEVAMDILFGTCPTCTTQVMSHPSVDCPKLPRFLCKYHVTTLKQLNEPSPLQKVTACMTDYDCLRLYILVQDIADMISMLGYPNLSQPIMGENNSYQFSHSYLSTVCQAYLNCHTQSILPQAYDEVLHECAW